MYACSRAVVFGANSCAFCSAAYAFGTASSVIGMLMLAPYANAIPQWAIAQFGSSRADSWKDRIASGWLNAKQSIRPWSKYCCASFDDVVTV